MSKRDNRMNTLLNKIKCSIKELTEFSKYPDVGLILLINKHFHIAFTHLAYYNIHELRTVNNVLTATANIKIDDITIKKTITSGFEHNFDYLIKIENGVLVVKIAKRPVDVTAIDIANEITKAAMSIVNEALQIERRPPVNIKLTDAIATDNEFMNIWSKILARSSDFTFLRPERQADGTYKHYSRVVIDDMTFDIKTSACRGLCYEINTFNQLPLIYVSNSPVTSTLIDYITDDFKALLIDIDSIRNMLASNQ